MQSRGIMRNGSAGREKSLGSRVWTGAAGALVIGGAIVMGGAAGVVTALAHSGTVATSENCSTWTASVTLANNVTSDRFVDVLTTIPGTTGITNGHYDTSKGLIWSATGAAPASGKVTLNIYTNSNNKPGALEFTAAGSLVPATGCMSSPTLSTNASAGGAVGTAIHDTATLAGANAPTGNIVFNLYPSLTACNAGTGSLFMHSSPLSAAAPYTASSTDFSPTTVGTFQWRATYAGDAKNHGATSACGSEPVTISQASSAIVTKQSAGGPVGTVLSDTATVTGSAGSPSGTVVFRLYAPSNPTCNPDNGAAAFTSAAIKLTSVSPGVSNAASGPYTSATVGQYHWVASYSGDGVYKAATSGCADEPVTTTQAAPSIATTASAGGNVPVAVSDSAVVSGGHNPTGSVVFTLYPSLAACNAATGAVYTSPAEALTAGKAASGSFTLTTAGTYQWVAKYSGDATNASTSSKCGDEPVTAGAGSVLGITTPATGGTGSLTGITIGGFLLLGGLGLALLGGIAPRRRRA